MKTKATTKKEKTMSTKKTALLTPVPTNDSWGFYGTLMIDGAYGFGQDPTESKTISEETACRLWNTATQALAKAFNENDPMVIRNFLRSRYGRHLADSVYNHAEKITEKELKKAIPLAVNDIRGGKNIWAKSFTCVKLATINGTWED